MRPFYWFSVSLIAVVARILLGLRVYGLSNLPKPPFIVAGNHVSLMDPPLIGCAIPIECAFMAKVELFKNPLFGRLIGSLNAFPVRRGLPDREAIERALAILRGGRALVLFPEGTRDKTARLRPARGGVGFFAVHTGLPVVPVYIDGAHRMRKAILRRPRISVTFGPPLPHVPAPADDPAARRLAYEAVGRHWYDAVRAMRRQVTGRDGPEIPA